ncbi:hypothetical protein G6O69_00485 [Pseudenhygromyxa sp. WMMC2535]|uniref:hypothetical protein n=1 Tax=Pseudenhygromyxa sp. WMMC2535 TaxID=2712867 RepID=UPI001551914C|nr:hypothetical protein [Pseudenhygromyxa sp. WMMC2535]NVB36287.1 hypothetical protein [Pseudenhygromyxa sp. WMMC2535]
MRETTLRPLITLLIAPAFAVACSDDGSQDDEIGSVDGSDTSETSDASTGESESSESGSESSSSSDTGSSSESGSETDSETDSSSTDTGESGCQPNPELCEGGTVCDVITGDCVAEGSPCTLSGASTSCGDSECGPGSVCNDQGSCIAVAPCSAVTCEEGQCWGTACVCDRPAACETPTLEALDGAFAVDIFDLEFADDCNAWMVTLRSGTDYVRRMTPGGTLTEWDGVANLNMGEIKVLKALNPQYPLPPLGGVEPASGGEPQTVGGDNFGEVAITYTCCPTCGCQADPPQGVARLIEGDLEPLPIVLPAVATQGNDGPFGGNAADAGPMGLTWGDDLRLYVGNANQNGDFDTVDLINENQELLGTFGSRVTAAAPLTAVHLLVALDTGELLRFNTATLESTPVVDLEVSVTSLSHDSFTGLVYASLSDLSIVEVQPFTGEVSDFDVMPNLGRVTVSPDGVLWWVPAKHIVGNLSMVTWALPASF